MADLEQTEASCLLQTGALYRRRVGLVSATGPTDLRFAGFKKGAFSLYFGDAPIYHFDLEGRWQRAYVGATHYLKSLDTSVHAIDRVREGANLVLKRRALPDDEIRDLDRQIRDIALDLIAELDGGSLRRQEPPMDKALPLDNAALRDFLARIAHWDAQPGMLTADSTSILTVPYLLCRRIARTRLYSWPHTVTPGDWVLEIARGAIT